MVTVCDLLRCEGAPDLTVTQEEVEKISHEIEEKLFNLYQDITPKYKNKYRSLLFNLKDLKNQVCCCLSVCLSVLTRYRPALYSMPVHFAVYAVCLFI